jgi:hypothetical protein
MTSVAQGAGIFSAAIMRAILFGFSSGRSNPEFAFMIGMVAHVRNDSPSPERCPFIAAGAADHDHHQEFEEVASRDISRNAGRRRGTLIAVASSSPAQGMCSLNSG